MSAASAAIFKPLDPKLLNKPSGQCAFQLLGTTSLIPFGHATCTFKKSETKTEIRTPEEPGRGIIATDYSELSGMVDIEFGTLNTLGLALSHMGKNRSYTQGAVQAKSQTFRGAMALEWLELKAGANPIEEAASTGLVNTVVTKVTLGGVDLPSGSYRHDSFSGIVQVTKWPEDAELNEDVVVSFSAPEVLASDGQNAVDLLSELSLEGRFVLRQNNGRGINRKIVLPSLTFGGESGDVSWIADSNEITKVTTTGTMTADYSQPAGQEYGYMVELKKRAA